MSPVILVVEDERKLAMSLREGLQDNGFEVIVALDGEDGYFQLMNKSVDLVLLDWMLPGRDGLTILNAIRGKGLSLPVLMLTARDAVEDRVRGLNAGADDYLIKPFALPELLARIRALLRRTDRESVVELRAADLRLHILRRTVHRGAQPVDLTPTEFDLLTVLLQHRDHIVSRSMLAEAVWGSGNRATPLDNVLDVHMSRLRRKIDQPFATRLIHTVRGVGFRIGELR